MIYLTLTALANLSPDGYVAPWDVRRVAGYSARDAGPIRPIYPISPIRLISRISRIGRIYHVRRTSLLFLLAAGEHIETACDSGAERLMGWECWLATAFAR